VGDVFEAHADGGEGVIQGFFAEVLICEGVAVGVSRVWSISEATRLGERVGGGEVWSSAGEEYRRERTWEKVDSHSARVVGIAGSILFCLTTYLC
jgi:hypothetical protein